MNEIWLNNFLLTKPCKIKLLLKRHLLWTSKYEKTTCATHPVHVTLLQTEIVFWFTCDVGSEQVQIAKRFTFTMMYFSPFLNPMEENVSDVNVCDTFVLKRR